MSDFRYILISIPKALPIPMALGLCVPSICSVNDFTTFKPFIVSAFNKIISELFEGVKGFEPDT
jgi:hypothetical protein